MRVETRTIERVEADLAAATAAGHEAKVRELQRERERFVGGVERVAYRSGSVTLRDEQRSSAPSTSRRPNVSGGAGIAVVLSADADEAIRESEASDGLEIAGGLYGFWGDREIVVEQATVFRDTVRTRHRTEIDLRQLQDMDQHFRQAGWRAVGEWHSHVTPGHPASPPDKNGWIAQADARGLSWLGVIVEPRSTWTGDDWYRPTFRAFLARPGESRVAPVPVTIERSRS